MNEKRFTYKSMCLYDKGVIFARAKTLVDADIICRRLNKMNEENLELKEYSKELLIYINKGCPKSKRRLIVD